MKWQIPAAIVMTGCLFYAGWKIEAVISSPARITVNVSELPPLMLRRIVREEIEVEISRINYLRDVLREEREEMDAKIKETEN